MRVEEYTIDDDRESTIPGVTLSEVNERLLQALWDELNGEIRTTTEALRKKRSEPPERPTEKG